MYTYNYEQPNNISPAQADIETQIFDRYNSKVAYRLNNTKAGADKPKSIQSICRHITKLVGEQKQIVRMHDKLVEMNLTGPLSELKTILSAYGWAIIELRMFVEKLTADA